MQSKQMAAVLMLYAMNYEEWQTILLNREHYTDSLCEWSSCRLV